jgi:hypothetical protein
MPSESDAYQRGLRLGRELGALRREVGDLDASDTACKERVMQSLDEARRHLQAALAELSGLV